MSDIDIREASFPAQTEIVREIFREYADGLSVDLCFQDFESEVRDLPGRYSLPRGRVLLAFARGALIGCVAMRPVDDEACEMKRLYVRPEGRGLGAGRQLVQRLCGIAESVGYRRVCLDTLATMHAAQSLYASLGFKAIKSYVFNPIEGTKFFAKDLSVTARSLDE